MAKGLTEEEIKAIRLKAYLEPDFFCSFFFPDWFPAEIPWVHLGILAIELQRTDFLLNKEPWILDKIRRHFVFKEDFDDDDSPEHEVFIFNYDDDENLVSIDLEIGQYTMLMMPRGFAKTTLSNAINLFQIVYNVKHVIVYASESAGHAENQLANIKNEIETNQRLITFFGELKPLPSSGKKWSAPHIECSNGVVVVAKGRGGQIRGMNFGARRPDKILLDDVEDEESVKTDEQRAKAKKWFFAAVEPALDWRNPFATLMVTGTLLHADSLLMTLARDPRFNAIRFSAIDRDGEALWPLRMDLNSLEKKKQAFARAGELATFYMEYMNQLRNDETAKFRKDFFRIEPLRWQDLDHKALVIDPAISDKPDADFCAFAVVAMLPKGHIHVLECFGKKGMLPREQIDTFFDLRKIWRGTTPVAKNGIEAHAYQRALVHLVREEMFRKKDYFNIEEIFHKQNKVERVEGILQPRFANGYITFQKPFPLLETQLLDWPNGKKDLPDVLAMALALLDPYAASAAGDVIDLGEDEYEPLEHEIGDWRTAP